MDDADELDRLRQRAYGPEADIHADPVALARLRDLEEAGRLPLTEPRSQPAPSPERVALVAADSEVLAEPPPHEPDPQPAPSGRRVWSRRRTGVVAAVLLVAVVLVAVGTTAFLTRRSGYTAPVAAVLAPVPDREVPAIFGITDGDSVVYADFAGVTPISSEATWYGQGSQQCLLIAETARLRDATENAFPGFAYSGCGAGPFPATITFSVTPDMPEAMRERYPVGSSLQFILEDDGVVVLSASPTPTPTAG